MARYIDADALLEEIEKLNWDDDVMYHIVKVFIEDAPTSDVVEVKHGEWEHECLECSVCKRNISEIYDADSYMAYGIEDELKYCPYCGAKMDGGNADGKEES